MAVVKITPIEIEKFNVASPDFTLAGTSVDATDGATFVIDDKDFKYTVILTNSASAAKKATIVAGTGVQGVDDLEVSVAASKAVAINLESGRFGKGDEITIKGESANIGVLVIKNA